jgi:hypothetical protein
MCVSFKIIIIIIMACPNASFIKTSIVTGKSAIIIIARL